MEEEENKSRRVRRRLEEARDHLTRNQESLQKLMEENDRIAADKVESDLQLLSKRGRVQSLTLEEGYDEVVGEETRDDAAKNSEENQFGPSTLPSVTLVGRLKNKMVKNCQKEKEQVGGESGGVLGHIVKVHIKDFMVHRDFDWRPGHCINFITGKNGSGKSSLLQAIVLGLMSGTKHVGRYSRLGDFVRKGSQK